MPTQLQVLLRKAGICDAGITCGACRLVKPGDKNMPSCPQNATGTCILAFEDCSAICLSLAYLESLILQSLLCIGFGGMLVRRLFGMTATTSCTALRTRSSTSRTRPASGFGLGSEDDVLLHAICFMDGFPCGADGAETGTCLCSLKGVLLSLPCPTQQACPKLSIGHSGLPSSNSGDVEVVPKRQNGWTRHLFAHKS